MNYGFIFYISMGGREPVSGQLDDDVFIFLW